MTYEIARSSTAPKVGAIKHQAFSHYAGRNPANKLIKSVDYATFQMPDGSRPLAGVDMGVHKTLRLLVRPVIDHPLLRKL